MSVSPIDAVVAGHICLDITPRFPAGRDRTAAVAEVFRPGTLLKMDGLAISTGGLVANTGINLLTLGMKVELMGKVGDDLLARGLLDLLAARGLDGAMRRVPGEQTSYTVVLAPPGLDRMFLHCTGANDTFCADDIDYDTVARARLFHFGYPPIMDRMHRDDGRELAAIFRRVRSLGVATSLDMAMPDPASPAGRADWGRILENTLPHVDFFVPSLEEILYMLDRDRFQALLDRAAREGGGFLDLATGDDLSRLGDRLLAMGAKAVVVKCGSRGVYGRTASASVLRDVPLLRDNADLAEKWSDREYWQAPFRVEKVVSATGAGDSAIAGFLAAALRGLSFAEALGMACAVGSCNVTALDALSGVRSWDETRRLVAEGWAPHPVKPPGPDWQPLIPGALWSAP